MLFTEIDLDVYFVVHTTGIGSEKLLGVKGPVEDETAYSSDDVAGVSGLVRSHSGMYFLVYTTEEKIKLVACSSVAANIAT